MYSQIQIKSEFLRQFKKIPKTVFYFSKSNLRCQPIRYKTVHK